MDLRGGYRNPMTESTEMELREWFNKNHKSGRFEICIRDYVADNQIIFVAKNTEGVIMDIITVKIDKEE